MRVYVISTLGCVCETLFPAYLNLSYHINIFDKNYKCLKELRKIIYDLQ